MQKCVLADRFAYFFIYFGFVLRIRLNVFNENKRIFTRVFFSFVIQKSRFYADMWKWVKWFNSKENIPKQLIVFDSIYD